MPGWSSTFSSALLSLCPPFLISAIPHPLLPFHPTPHISIDDPLRSLPMLLHITSFSFCIYHLAFILHCIAFYISSSITFFSAQLRLSPKGNYTYLGRKRHRHPCFYLRLLLFLHRPHSCICSPGRVLATSCINTFIPHTCTVGPFLWPTASDSH